MEEKVSFWRSLGLAFLCWTVVGIILGWALFSDDRDHGNLLPLKHYFVWEAAEAYSWALITPLLFVFARRYPFDREHWRKRVAQYALFLAAVLQVRPILAGLGWFYRPDRQQSFLATISHLRTKELPGTIQITLVLFILSAYQNARREARRRQLREAEMESRVSTAELQMLRMQLHPHFLFNSLQAATVLIHEDPAAAESVLQRLSELLRVALDDTRSMQVPLAEEIAFLENYVEIQKQRFRERLQVRMKIAPDALQIPVPSLLLQPLVENAIHHGIGRHKGSDTIEVSARRDGLDLLLQVKNNASHLVVDAEPSGNGVGLKNTRARLQQMYGEQAALQLTPLSPSGVCASVRLPVELTP
jgi:two-component system, LytTR family, sensor kinase